MTSSAAATRIAIPYGEDWDFDLIFQRPDSDALERVQVKHVRPNGNVIRLEARSASLTKGKVKRIKRYTAATIDWLAAFEPTSNRCYYIPRRRARQRDGPDQSATRAHAELPAPACEIRRGLCRPCPPSRADT